MEALLMSYEPLVCIIQAMEALLMSYEPLENLEV